MEYPSRCWYETENGWASKDPTDEDKIRRKLASHEAEKRVHEMRLRINQEDRRQLEQELRRRG